MLAKKYRLPIQEVVKKTGETLKTPYFLIKIFSNNFSYARVGIVISKKIAPKATDRNRLKRKIFFAISNIIKSKNHTSAGKDFLIIISERIKELRDEDLYGLLAENLK